MVCSQVDSLGHKTRRPVRGQHHSAGHAAPESQSGRIEPRLLCLGPSFLLKQALGRKGWMPATWESYGTSGSWALPGTDLAATVTGEPTNESTNSVSPLSLFQMNKTFKKKKKECSKSVKKKK